MRHCETKDMAWLREVKVAHEEGDTSGPPTMLWWPGWGLDQEAIKAYVPRYITGGDCESWVERMEDDLWEDGLLRPDEGEHLTPEQIMERWPHKDPREGWIGIVEDDEGWGWTCELSYGREKPRSDDYKWSKVTVVEYDWRRR